MSTKRKNSSGQPDQIFTNLKDHARRIITDKSLLDTLIDKLYDNDLLLHYITHFEEISYGQLSPMNVAVLFGLERAYWQTLHSTTNMVYKDVTKRWYAFCERLFGGSYIYLCSGSKNFGQVISWKTKKGKYDPNKSKINFAQTFPKNNQAWHNSRSNGPGWQKLTGSVVLAKS